MRILRRGRRGYTLVPPRDRWEVEPPDENRTVTSTLAGNKSILQEVFDCAGDLVIHEFMIAHQKPAMIAFIDSLVNYQHLQQGLLRFLQAEQDLPPGATMAWLQQEVIPLGRMREENRWVEITEDICGGYISLFVEGEPTALLISILEDNSRGVNQPTTETVVRGPADAFNEDLRTNIALLRKRLKTSRLAVENLKLGEVTKTSACLVYLKGYVASGMVEEIYSRIQRIKVDSILGSGQVEEYIDDNPYSPFSTVAATERPDNLAAQLLEGKAGLIMDNSPFALVVPTMLASQVISPEDYYNRYWFASMIRILRWGSLLTALLGPAFYIAISTFHQELIPPSLLFSIIVAREGIPFPALVEAALMELTFEVLREGGVRLPRPFGQTISIVGAIVIGQAAVSAGLVSPVMVIVVALTAIASFTIPSVTLSNTVRILRFPFMLAGAFLGLFGVATGFSVLVFHLCALRSFGVPYLSPLAPHSLGDLKDTFVRVPAWMMRLRPRLTGYREPERQNSDLQPAPPSRKTPARGPKGGKK